MHSTAVLPSSAAGAMPPVAMAGFAPRPATRTPQHAAAADATTKILRDWLRRAGRRR